ncbi:MAG: SUMF1/EgtB/PvdO family nonheme iron enzyme [Verrucomicrobia bacterium]|nr:SUMF1/EgtB/PvdO family nonheme iron enzyme [Kiritimatiellia bacterium]MCP5489167.1 SUMF1/EgtB/PvdO family nonheme iron enzyme [Verrucomicrobiota bacterium]
MKRNLDIVDKHSLRRLKRLSLPGHVVGVGMFLLVVLGSFLGVSAYNRSGNPGPWKVFSNYGTETLSGAWENSIGMRFRPLPGHGAVMSIWETRMSDFERFVAETEYDATGDAWAYQDNHWYQSVYSWSNTGYEVTMDHPVCSISWRDAMTFCAWLTRKERASGAISPNQHYRLPTEEEWSTAVGVDAGQGTPGLSPSLLERLKIGNYRDTLLIDDYAFTSPVGSFSPNALGFYDLGGNVWEYCLDQDAAQNRVIRGGSWLNHGVNYSRATARARVRETVRSCLYGFRVVLDESPGLLSRHDTPEREPTPGS